MKVLSVVWFKVLPSKYGGQKGTALFNNYLSKYVDLTCLCSKNNIAPDGLPYTVIAGLPVSKLQFLNPLCWCRITTLAKKTGAELLLLEYPYYAIAAVLAKKFLRIKLVLHEHNIEYARFRALRNWWWRLLFWYERWACRQADLVLFKTAQDATCAVKQFKILAGNCLVVPYGVEKNLFAKEDTNIRKQYGISPQEKIILFAGTLDYEPNAEAVKNIYFALAPQLEKTGQHFKILICGRLKLQAFYYLKNYQHPNIVFAGEVEDIDPYFAAADVFINPVLYNGGIQTKFIDALSRHCTVVAFEKALAGFDATIAAEKIICVTDRDWKGFAAAIKKAGETKAETPAAFFEKYSWEQVVKKTWAKMQLLFSLS